MPAPKIYYTEEDLTARVPSFKGVYGAIVLPAKKGPVDQPVLVSSEADLLRQFTPKNRLDIGCDMSFFSALAFLSSSDKLWVRRAAAPDVMYGGASFFVQGQCTNVGWGIGEEEPSGRTFQSHEMFALFGASPGAYNNDVCVKVYGNRDSETLGVSKITRVQNSYTQAQTNSTTEKLTKAHSFDTGDPVVLSFAGVDITLPTVSILSASDKFASPVRVATGTPLRLTSNGAPAELNSGYIYYAVDVSDGYNYAFQLATTPDDANASPANIIEFSSFTDSVRFVEQPVLPAELEIGGIYYVIKTSSTEIQLAASLADAIAGTFIEFGDFGSGVTVSRLYDLQLSQPWVSGEQVRIDAGMLMDPLSLSSSYWLVKINDRFFLSTSFAGALEASDLVDLEYAGEGLSSDEINTTAHTFAFTRSMPTGTPVKIVSGNVPTPLTVGNTYYAIRLNSKLTRLAVTAEAAALGQAINTQAGRSETVAQGSINATNNTFAVTEDLPTGMPVILASAGFPVELNASNTYYIINISPTSVKLAATLIDATEGNAIDFSAFTASCVLTEQFYGNFLVQEGVTIIPAKGTNIPNAFVIEVVDAANLNSLLEPAWTVSRVKGATDGHQNSIYIEDVLLASDYVRAVNNEGISQTARVQSQLVPLALQGGDDGSPVTDDVMVLALQSAFRNKNDRPVVALMDGGWATPAYATAIVEIAGARLDCGFFLSTPYALEASQNYINRLIDYRKNILNVNSTRGILVSPHVKVLDKFNGIQVWAPQDGYAAACFSATAMNYEMWYPIAGVKRGVLNVIDVRRRFTDGEMDLLSDAQINPIQFAPGKGIRLWGQRTLTSIPGAFDRFNVRAWEISIHPGIIEALESFQFDIGGVDAMAQCKDMLTSFFESNKARGGVYSYRIVCGMGPGENNTQNDIDNYRMNVWAYASPARGIEDVLFKLIVTNDGPSIVSVTQAS